MKHFRNEFMARWNHRTVLAYTDMVSLNEQAIEGPNSCYFSWSQAIFYDYKGSKFITSCPKSFHQLIMRQSTYQIYSDFKSVQRDLSEGTYTWFVEKAWWTWWSWHGDSSQGFVCNSNPTFSKDFTTGKSCRNNTANTIWIWFDGEPREEERLALL